MPAQAVALMHRPIRLVSSDKQRKAPEKLTVHQVGYVQHVEKQLENRNRRIQQLETNIDDLKDDRRACLCAIGCLIATLGIVLYQWLVVCHGQAPV